VPASPSLAPVRALLAAADCVLAVGTELGPTDCDMYGDGAFPALPGLIRLDIDAGQLARHPAEVALQGDCAAVLPLLQVPPRTTGGAARAAAARTGALAALPPGYGTEVALLAAIRNAVPGALIVGDSTQTVYAGNLYHDHDRPGGWFNSATGFGALGYAPGAAVGAALADPVARVICLVGDGGLMFGPGEVITAVEENLDIAFVVFDNAGFGEIALAMRDAGAAVIGCTPRPPVLESLAKAFGLPFAEVDEAALPATIAAGHGPRLLRVPRPAISDQ
jgi:acetolactate synthase-1/2/3 large subunit